jgi:hypothetical protein
MKEVEEMTQRAVGSSAEETTRYTSWTSLVVARSLTAFRTAGHQFAVEDLSLGLDRRRTPTRYSFPLERLPMFSHVGCSSAEVY